MVPAAVGAIAPRCARPPCGGAPLPTGVERSGGDDEEDMEGWKEGTEARNDEPRRGSKNRRAFRETTAAVGECREDLGGGEKKANEERAIREARRRWKGRAEGLEAAEIVP